MVASLEQWAVMPLKPNIPMILKEENIDEDTRERFSRAKKPSEFSIIKMDYRNTESEEADDEPTFNSSPNKHKNKTNKELLQNISTGLKNILMVASKKKVTTKNSRSERSVSLKTLLRLFLLSWHLSKKQGLLKSIISRT